MDLSNDFRTRGRRCLALAGAAPTLEAQAHWLSMAQLWHALAQHAEDQEQLFVSRSAASIAGSQRGTDNTLAT
jgi:hypothetical protein